MTFQVPKTCTKCKSVRLMTDFNKDVSKKDGLHSICRECQRIQRAERYSDPVLLEQRREKSRQFRRSHPQKFKRSVRSATLKAKYGISADDYDRMLAEQGGVCAICGADNPRISARYHLHVDHDHATGKVRGLLCQPCNTSIGRFMDNPELIRKAADYLEKEGVSSNS